MVGGNSYWNFKGINRPGTVKQMVGRHNYS